MFKSNQTRYVLSLVYIVSKNKKFCNTLPRKKVSISYGNVRFFSNNLRLLNFKNRPFSSGQGLVQIEPNSVWSIPCVPRVKNITNFWYSLPRKKVLISIGNIDFFAYSSFKNIEILSGQGVVRIEPNSVCIIPFIYIYKYIYIYIYIVSKRKRIFNIACLGKKLVFHTEISDFFRIT